jgi:hypothetical protein
MSTYRFANNAATTLGSVISPSATTITVASGTGALFPNPVPGTYFTATLFASPTGAPNEIVLVTARSGDTMTVIRAQEGTTAQAWSVGNTFSNFISAGFLNQVVDTGSLQTQPGNYAADTGTANVGVIVMVPAPSALSALVGVPIRVKKGGSFNTSAYSLNVNGLGVQNVLIGGMNCEGGEIIANEIFEVIYDGSNFNLISNPGTLHGDRLTGSSVPNAALVQMSAMTLKGNLSGGVTSPYDIPLAALRDALGLHPISGVFDVNGYVFRSDGLLEQWGQAYSGAGDSTPYATVGFNIPFPTACFNVSANSAVEYHGAADGNEISSNIIDASSFRLGSDDTRRLCNWRAIGI